MMDKGISERVRQQSVRLTFLEGNRDTDVTFEGQKFKVETFFTHNGLTNLQHTNAQ